MVQQASKKRGVALLTALFFGCFCISLSTGFLLQVPVDLGATAQLERDTRANYVAEAAVEHTMAWISHEIENFREPCTSTNPKPVRSGSLDGLDWTCQVEADGQTPPHGLAPLRVYKLTATVSQAGQEHFRVVADVQAGQSFARYSMFINQDGVIAYDFLVTEHSQVKGPIHKNRPISFLVSPSLLNHKPDSGIPFDSTISTTESHHKWYVGGVMYEHLEEAKYQNFLGNGVDDLEYKAKPKLMPSDSTPLAQAAWGGDAPAGLSLGVSANPMGGVYINGDVTSLELSVNGNGHFELRIDQGGLVTTVIEDAQNNRRLVTEPSGTMYAVDGLGTGVIFATGDIQAIKGKNKGAHTIANKFEDGKTMEIAGSITRADTPVKSEPTGTDDRLGLVSGKITVADESVLPRNVNQPLYLYASIMATDVFQVKDRFTGNPGAMAIYGGLASDKAWETVDFNNLNELRTTSGYGGLSGFGSANIFYDKLLADEPPPEYPTTASADLSVRSWKEQPL